MNKKMEMSFWVPAIGGLLLTVAGASLGLWSAISSHNDSLQEKAKADRIASEHTLLLKQNYQKSLSIIDELNTSSEKTRTLLDNTNEVLKSQKEAGILLSQQVNESTKINSSILESGKNVVSSINTASKNLDENLTGGESYCNIQIVNAGKGIFRLSAINNFHNTIPNVILKIQNYSAIEKCNFVTIGGVRRIDLKCYNANSIELPPTIFNINTNYFIGGDNYIDISGNQGKLSVFMITPKNTFYTQIIYQMKSETQLMFLYRILKKVADKYIVIESNDDKSDPDNPARWDAMFALPPEMPTSQ